MAYEIAEKKLPAFCAGNFQAISNLLANAVSYTPKGGSIRIYIANQKLILENECVPIPQKYLTHIFEPFYRPEYGRSPDTGGNGLG